MVKIANVFNVHIYELLKPPNLLPDNLNSILKKYTEDVNAAIDNINSTLLEDEKMTTSGPLTHLKKNATL
jgi:hypothetical protein